MNTVLSFPSLLPSSSQKNKLIRFWRYVRSAVFVTKVFSFALKRNAGKKYFFSSTLVGSFYVFDSNLITFNLQKNKLFRFWWFVRPLRLLLRFFSLHQIEMQKKFFFFNLSRKFLCFWFQPYYLHFTKK